MSLERWGAFSVIDHKDAAALAVEVLLYDRLVLPYPTADDRDRWIERGWDPEGLDQRIAQLGDIALPAKWDKERQKAWRHYIAQTKMEAHTETAGYAMTATVLADPKYRPTIDKVTPLSVVAAYQSDSDAGELHPALADPHANESFDFLLGQKLLVPDDTNAEDALKRAIELTRDDGFRLAREDLFKWQNDLSERGLPAEATIAELERLVERYNGCIERKSKRSRIEIAILVGTLTAAGAATVAGLAPAYFAALGIGALTGASVMQLGSFATGGMLQVAQQLNDDDADRHEVDRTAPAAMFHQIENRLDMRWRPASNGS